MNGTGSGSNGDRIGNRSRATYSFFLLSSGAILALDCATKTWARRHLAGFFDSVNPSGPITLMLEQNPAGAFGLMLGTNTTVNFVTFSLLSLVSIAAVGWLFARLRPRRAPLKWGLPLVMGGALGNLLDRLRFGHVLDFIDLHVLFLGAQRRAPRFNLADVAITIGVALLAVEVARHRRRASDPEPGSSGSPQTTG